MMILSPNLPLKGIVSPWICINRYGKNLVSVWTFHLWYRHGNSKEYNVTCSLSVFVGMWNIGTKMKKRWNVNGTYCYNVVTMSSLDLFICLRELFRCVFWKFLKMNFRNRQAVWKAREIVQPCLQLQLDNCGLALLSNSKACPCQHHPRVCLPGRVHLLEMLPQ